MHRFQAILFDLDGTLIDSAPDLRDATNMILHAHGLRALTLEEIKSCTGDGLRALLRQAFTRAGRAMDEPALTALMPVFTTHYNSIVPELSCIYNGVAALLQAQRESGVKLALVTNKVEASTHYLLTQLDLAKYFDVIVGGDTLPVAKPDPAPLMHALQKLGIEPAHAIMVGDSLNDALAAKAAGIPCIILRHGYGTPDIGRHAPVFYADDIAACPVVLAATGAASRSDSCT